MSTGSKSQRWTFINTNRLSNDTKMRCTAIHAGYSLSTEPFKMAFCPHKDPINTHNCHHTLWIRRGKHVPKSGTSHFPKAQGSHLSRLIVLQEFIFSQSLSETLNYYLKDFQVAHFKYQLFQDLQIIHFRGVLWLFPIFQALALTGEWNRNLH